MDDFEKFAINFGHRLDDLFAGIYRILVGCSTLALLILIMLGVAGYYIGRAFFG